MAEEARIAAALQAVIDGRSLDPFAMLGPHRTASGDVEFRSLAHPIH
jgi:hypothetical protein